MPRKAFVADLQEAIREFGSPNFSDLKPGDEDGTIAFQYYDHGGDAQGTTIQAIVPGKIANRPFLSSFLRGAWSIYLIYWPQKR